MKFPSKISLALNTANLQLACDWFWEVCKLDTASVISLTAGYLILINLISFALFGTDKRRAMQNGWRIPESRLLMFALLGGVFGAFFGRRYYRHKTRKQPFTTMLYTIAVVQVLVLVALCYAYLTGKNILQYLP